MNQLEPLSNIAEQLLFETSPITTSADVVMKASGLRIEAIRAIAREQGVEIEDTACRCIEGNLLASLADAHIRRLKAYFYNAKRHIAELAGDELTTFVEFCKTYQKRQHSYYSSLVWSDIDTEAIREQFFDKVCKLTPPEKPYSPSSALLLDEILKFRSPKLDDSTSFREVMQEDVIDKVVHSFLYYEKPFRKVNFILDLRFEARKTILSARYHIFSSDDEDHHCDVVSKFY